MSVSFAITVKDEINEIKALIELLLKYKSDDDEIVVVQDMIANNLSVREYLTHENRVFKYPFNFKNDFSKMKNYMNSVCTKDWIFNIDADELPHEWLLTNLPKILNVNTTLEVIWVPRINIVNGITEEHISKWGWKVNDKGWINWPNDSQCRIYKNIPGIYWDKKVHEQLRGGNVIGKLPDVEEYSIYHIKDIKRQERQNDFYNTL